LNAIPYLIPLIANLVRKIADQTHVRNEKKFPRWGTFILFARLFSLDNRIAERFFVRHFTRLYMQQTYNYADFSKIALDQITKQ
jgi:hypothetical protein